MESRANDSAYEALKTLSKEGDLKFDLGYVCFIPRIYVIDISVGLSCKILSR